jgi:hypothetical protein
MCIADFKIVEGYVEYIQIHEAHNHGVLRQRTDIDAQRRGRPKTDSMSHSIHEYRNKSGHSIQQCLDTMMYRPLLA